MPDAQNASSGFALRTYRGYPDFDQGTSPSRGPGKKPERLRAQARKGENRRGREIFSKKSHSVIFFNICPPLKIVIPPPLWETTMPTAWVTLVIAATEL